MPTIKRLYAWANPAFVQGADWILNLNAPRHSRIRSLIAHAFTARRISGLEPAIAKIADELIDAGEGLQLLLWAVEGHVAREGRPGRRGRSTIDTRSD